MVERRLTTILCYDVLGYSRAMSEDERGTFERLKALRRDVIEPRAAAHGGRTIKLMGDGGLIEFSSVVDAVAFAVGTQVAAAGHQPDLDEAQRLRLRIGINVGDVIVDGDDIYGDGVNVAARLEGLAEPGGICVRRNVRNQVRGKLDLDFADLGEVAVKNIARPIRAFHLVMNDKARALAAAPADAARPRARRVPVPVAALAGAGLLAAALAFGFWQIRGADWDATNAPDRAPLMSAKPLLAVLPFDDYGEDAATSRLARGMTEDIITDLARFPEFGVIARNSTETYAGKAIDARDVGKSLGVGYVLEGSIQRESDRLRITAQLIDAKTGGHLWSERWDRPAEDVFAIQTEIAETISNRLGGGAGLIQRTGRTEARRKRPEHLDAYDLYLLGTERLEEVTRESIDDAIRLLSGAVERDQGFARAWVELFHAHNLSRHYGADRDSAIHAAKAAAAKAMELDPGDPEAHAVHAMALMIDGDRVRAKAAFDEALRMAPNSFEILAFYASYASDFGEPGRGAELAERAIALNPSFPMWAASPFAWAFFSVGRDESALRMLNRLPPESYADWRWAVRGSALARLGRAEDAARTVRDALQHYPDLSIEGLVRDLGLVGAERSRWIEAMRLAGFPACLGPEERSGLAPDERLEECETGAQ